jgi:hypothetical protein
LSSSIFHHLSYPNATEEERESLHGDGGGERAAAWERKSRPRAAASSSGGTREGKEPAVGACLCRRISYKPGAAWDWLHHRVRASQGARGSEGARGRACRSGGRSSRVCRGHCGKGGGSRVGSRVSWYAVAAGCSQVREPPPPFAGERPRGVGAEQRMHGEGARTSDGVQSPYSHTNGLWRWIWCSP